MLEGHRSLNNFRYRKSILDIEITGYGTRIKSFSIDGVAQKEASVPCRLTGRHTLKIVLADEPLAVSYINKSAVIFAPETPVVVFSTCKLDWNSIPGAEEYEVFKNGKVILRTTDTSMELTVGDFAEYQVIAEDREKIKSFASEPVIVAQPEQKTIVEIEDFAPQAIYRYTGFNGSGFVETSKRINTMITIPVHINKAGTYAVNFRYANGNGPVNTENKCAIRTLKVNGKFAGTLVLPQRGKEEWSSWGYSNSIQAKLKTGKNDISVVFEPENENMNGEINSALLGQLQLFRISHR